MNAVLRRAAAVLGVLMAAGCDSCHGHDHPHEGEHAHGTVAGDGHVEHGDHAHGHGDDSIGITRWSDELELFAEHPPAVTGEELTFVAHLTILEGFEPLEVATVTLVLEGPERTEAKVTEMLRPGIFQPKLEAPNPGTYRGRLEVEGPEVTDTIEGFEIVVHPSAEAAKEAAAVSDEGGDSISFPKEQQWQVPFATAFAARERIVPTVEVAGEVTTPPSGQADVGAAIAGRVVAPKEGLPRPGQSVRRGTLLATIAPAPAAPEEGARAQLAVVEAKTRVQAARAAVERAERLIADRAISERQVEEARRELQVAEESLRAARRARAIFSGAASGRGAGTSGVTAPIDGVVVEVEATAGESVSSGERLFRIVDLSELWLKARIPEQEAAQLRASEGGAFKLPGLEQWLPLTLKGADASASVVNVGRTVDPRSRTVEVIYALRAPDERLRVGAMVRVAVPTGERWEGIVVPRSTVLEDDGRSLIYVQRGGEAFEERTVRLGPRAGQQVGIARGLEEDERVVTRGANIVRLSSRASSAPAHGHVH